MHNQLYIPKTITVGFVNRDDTFTGKLGYVIYTDDKGVLRKEKSWNSWRNKNIPAVTVDNVPTNGFTFNKGVQRDGHWGSGRSVVRVWDPRDHEFEISVDNLIGLLMHSDVSKRDIVEKCVYAWNGTELILLPVNSVEYVESSKYTAKQAMSVSAKDVVPGYSYTVKKDPRTVVYLGHFNRWKLDYAQEDSRYNRRYNNSYVQTKKKGKFHAFMDPATKEVLIKDPKDYLSSVALEEVHPEYAAMMDVYYSSAESQPIAGVQLMPSIEGSYTYRYGWVQISDTEFAQIVFERTHATVGDFARFVPDQQLLDRSNKAVDRGYYGRETMRPRPLPGLSEDLPVIRNLLVEINAMYQRQFAASPSSRTSYDYNFDRTMSERATKEIPGYKASQLQFILADGKKANDHFINY